MVKNSKAKIRRTFKNYGIDLSGEVDLPDLESFQTRKQFNEWKEKQSSFTNRNNLHYQFIKNDKGVSASKALINKIQRDTKTAQRIADKKIEEINKLSNTPQGERLAQRRFLSGREQNVTGISRPRDFNFNNIHSHRQLMDRAENARKKSTPDYYDERNETMRNNFVEILELSFNSDVSDVVDMIKQMNPDDFYELYLIYFDTFDFALYDSEGQNVDADQGTIEEMKGYLEAYFNGEIDLSLKNFPNR
jgi:hypothetical protein